MQKSLLSQMLHKGRYKYFGKFVLFSFALFLDLYRPEDTTECEFYIEEVSDNGSGVEEDVQLNLI